MDNFVRKKRVLLVVDWQVKPAEWSFLNAVSLYGHSYEILDSDLSIKYSSKFEKAIYRWGGYIKLGFKAYLRRGNYDVVLTWQWVAGMWYGIFARIFGGGGPKLILMGFFYTKRKSRIYSFLRYSLIRFALSAVDRVICYSSHEVKYHHRFFRCKNEKFVFIHLGIDTKRSDIQKALNTPVENYIFSPGTSNRDYATLFEAVKDLDIKVVVITKPFNIKGLKIPENVEVYFDIYGEQYRQFLWKSKFVVVSLDDVEVSSGQMVLLDCLLYGKALIITHACGTVDYIINGKDGLLVSAHNSKILRENILYLLEHPDEISRIGENARRTVSEKYSMLQFAKKVSDLISSV